MLTQPEPPLCICHHFLTQHDTLHRDGVPVANPPCLKQGCKCLGYQPVSRKSSHVYQRGAWTGRKQFGLLESGDRLLVVHNGYQLAVAEAKADALIAFVTGSERMDPHPADRFDSGRWRWTVDTDLGPLGPLPGHTMTMIVKGARW